MLCDRGFLGRKVQENEMPSNYFDWVRHYLPEQATGKLSWMSLPARNRQELPVCGMCGSDRWVVIVPLGCRKLFIFYLPFCP